MLICLRGSRSLTGDVYCVLSSLSYSCTYINTRLIIVLLKDHIKVSRGEENIFVWCVFMAICELVIDEAETYKWVKYIYIDDPISSLDDNNAIAVASDLVGWCFLCRLVLQSLVYSQCCFAYL